MKLLILSAILFFVFYRDYKKNKEQELPNTLNKFILTILVIMNIVSPLFTQMDANTNMRCFKGSECALKCDSVQGMFASTEYRVSKKESWTLEDNYFIKDSIMIRADRCEEL